MIRNWPHDLNFVSIFDQATLWKNRAMLRSARVPKYIRNDSSTIEVARDIKGRYSILTKRRFAETISAIPWVLRKSKSDERAVVLFLRFVVDAKLIMWAEFGESIKAEFDDPDITILADIVIKRLNVGTRGISRYSSGAILKWG